MQTEPALWNRLLAVAAVVFAVPVALELFALGAGPWPADAVRFGVAAGALCLAGPALLGLFGRLRRSPELRLARRLALVLAAQAVLLAAFTLV